MAVAGGSVVSGIDNIHLYVSDMDRSAAFYRDVLGIPLAGDEYWMEADLGGIRFALHPAPAGADLSAGTISVNFRVSDADAAAEHVRGAGYEAHEAMREEYGIAYEVVDPDGYRMRLLQPPS